MGKTVRELNGEKFSDSQIKYQWTKRHTRIEPYTQNGKSGKFTYDREFNLCSGVTQQEKDVTRNANRSLKKAVRQQHKKELSKELEEMKQSKRYKQV